MDGFSYNGNGEVALNPDKPKPLDPNADPPGSVQENPELDEFFQRLPANFRWPKPSDEAIAAAVEAVQRLSGASVVETLPSTETPMDPICSGCGQALLPGSRFCSACGGAAGGTATSAPSAKPSVAGQHHYHHHYHHFMSGPAGAATSGAEAVSSGPRGKAPTAASPNAPIGRAEIAARQVAQDWAQACNTKHLDDLLELYASDATVIRSSLPPVRSLPAIREFLFSLLEAGLGDVELESLRTDVMGEVAIDLGRCKMLVPVAMGKRREERGKYLLVLVRQPAGTWKIQADCWSSDLVVSPPPAPDAGRKGSEPTAPVRKVR